MNKYYKQLYRRIRVLESLLFEGKQDQEILNNFLGDEYYSKYNKIKNKIKDPEYKDIYRLIKKEPDEVKDYIDNIQSKTDKRRESKLGAKKLYEDSDWIVYKIITYESAVLYGKNTKWCITGNYQGHEERGEKYFYGYIHDYNLDGGYYFYINKHDPTEKYCILQNTNKKITSIWNAADENLGDSYTHVYAIENVILPAIKEIPESFLFNSNEINSIKINHVIISGKTDKLKEALDKGLDPNTIIEKQTLLTQAFINNKYEMFNMLLEYNANPNKQNAKGQTTLTVVSMLGDESDYTELLLDYGADPDIKDNKGHTAMYYARKYKNDSVYNTLEKYHAIEQ